MIDLATFRDIHSYKRFGYCKSIISEHVGISRTTVYKYWNMDRDNFEDALYHQETGRYFAL